MSASQLATRIGVTAGAVTGLIDRLEAGHFVRRQPDQRDRRRTLILVTDEHNAAMAAAFAPLAKTIQQLLDRYTPSQVATITEFLPHAAEGLEREAKVLERQ